MPYYFDTSALVKRYDPQENGAVQVIGFFSSPVAVFTSVITPLEVVSALRIKERNSIFTANSVQALVRALDLHLLTDYELLIPQPQTYLEARRLLLTYKLRAYDALHVATALTITSAARIPPSQLEFWTSDQDQAAAATAEGFTVTLV
ncbi:MAG: type II toxin-antitoxin system VapC family toxin [Thermaceae bacterium]|nr:type II toxin-antitoxin system VapC family toxin [Thermaceae bacterium]